PDAAARLGIVAASADDSGPDVLLALAAPTVRAQAAVAGTGAAGRSRRLPLYRRPGRCAAGPPGRRRAGRARVRPALQRRLRRSVRMVGAAGSLAAPALRLDQSASAAARRSARLRAAGVDADFRPAPRPGRRRTPRAEARRARHLEQGPRRGT